MLTLAIGDFLIPDRATELPPKFHKLLASSSSANKIQKVVCLGNITSSSSTFEFVKSISSDFEMVKGEFDEDSSIPLSLVYKIENFKIGVISGFSVVPQNDPLSLLTHARMLDVDILIWGGSSKVEAYTLDGKFFINPGSATGLLSFNELDKDDLELIEAELASVNNETEEKPSDGVAQKEKGNEDFSDLAKEQDKEEDEHTPNEDVSGKGQNDESNTETDDAAAESKHDAEEAQPTSTSTTKLEQHNNELELDNGKEEEKLNLLEELVSPIPSFCLLDIKGSICVTYIYTLIDNEIKIDKINYRKD